MGTIRDQMQPTLRGLLPGFFDQAGIEEHKATCDNCVMCPPPSPPGAAPRAGTEPTAARDYFRPDTKCCTWEPRLPNFAVGAILADPDPDLAEGQARLRRRIESRVGVTPQDVQPSRKQRMLREASRYHAFGRSADLRCSYYQLDNGHCTIWRHRVAIATTYYCKHDAGADGEAYWRRLGWYVILLEKRIATLVMARVSAEVSEPDLDPRVLSLEELEDRPPSARDYERWWGPYTGREEEFYRACHARACELGAADALELLGDKEGKRRLRMLEDAYQQLREPRFPPRLKLNPELAVVDGTDDVKLAVGYHRYDPLPLPGIVLRLCSEFDGSATVAEVQARIRERDDADFDDRLVLTLFQNRVLVEAPDAASRGATPER